MALNDFNRNYGMSNNSREFWGGNNAFVTVIVKLPANTEVGSTAVTQDGSNAAQTALTAAQLNQFRIAQALGQRCVIVATSIPSASVDPTVGGFGTVGGNVLAYGTAGTVASGSFAITYLVERADVLTKQTNKPGSTYAQTVDPCTDIANVIALPGFFEQSTGTASVAAAGVAIKVYGALPAIVA